MLRNRTTDITDYFPLQKSLIFEQINSLWKQPCLLAPRHSRNAFPGQMSLTTRHEERRLFSHARNKKNVEFEQISVDFRAICSLCYVLFRLNIAGCSWKEVICERLYWEPKADEKMTIRSVVLYRLPQLNTFRNLWFLWLSTEKGK